MPPMIPLVKRVPYFDFEGEPGLALEIEDPAVEEVDTEISVLLRTVAVGVDELWLRMGTWTRSTV